MAIAHQRQDPIEGRSHTEGRGPSEGRGLKELRFTSDVLDGRTENGNPPHTGACGDACQWFVNQSGTYK